jgi:hypothetical protein
VNFSLLFVVVAVALWLDVLFSTILGANAENVVVYKTFGILATLVRCTISLIHTTAHHHPVVHVALARSRLVCRPP